MRLLILSDRIPPENRGGAGEVAWRLALGLHQAGHEVAVVAATPGPGFEDERQGVLTCHLHSAYPERWRAYVSLANPQTLRPFAALLRRLRPQIVHAHNIHADLSYEALEVVRHQGLPTVFTAHDVMPFAYHKLRHFVRADRDEYGADDYRLPPLYNLWQMRLRYNPLRNPRIGAVLSRTSARIAPSAALALALRANGLPSFQVIHNGVDPAIMQVSPAAIQTLGARLGLEQGQPIVLFAGRLSAAKGMIPLLTAWRAVLERLPQARLLLLSATPIDEQLGPSWDDLRHSLVQGGWLSGEALAAAYALVRLVVVPSVVFDSFPTVNLEALAAGKPVVATCFGGSRELVRDGLEGFIINPLRADVLAERLLVLLSDQALAARMGEVGRRRIVQDGFSLAHVIAQHEALYDRLLSHTT
ncbi:MAG: glycosyltransferase family 4 protein [Anaerolineae bacterium]|nr:glycosyltransferase family 4 protein [Anaerolineae bacterium]MDW8172295.1 glycosyltransferase family 4 protein [Anaerolineae bacterium]